VGFTDFRNQEQAVGKGLVENRFVLVYTDLVEIGEWSMGLPVANTQPYFQPLADGEKFCPIPLFHYQS